MTSRVRSSCRRLVRDHKSKGPKQNAIINDLDQLIAVLRRSPVDLKIVAAIVQRNPELAGVLSQFTGRTAPFPMFLVSVGVGRLLQFLTRLRTEASLYLASSERLMP